MTGRSSCIISYLRARYLLIFFFLSITSRGSGPSKRGTPSFAAQRKSDEKSAALRTVQDFTGGRSSRNQSPARSGPPSGTHTPVEGTRSPNNQVTEEKVVKATKSTIEEFLSCRDLKVSNLFLFERSR